MPRPPRPTTLPDTHPYSLRQIEQMLGLTRRVIGNLIAAGFVTPRRGPRNAYRFSFQDVVLLRTAHQLRAARIPARRLLRSLRQLRAKLPDELPLSGLRIKVIGNDVAVRDADAQWEDPRGQLVMDFEWKPPGATAIHPASFAPPHVVGAPSGAMSARATASIGPEGPPTKSVATLIVGAPSGAIPTQAPAHIGPEGPPTTDPATLFDLALQHESTGHAGKAITAYQQVLNVMPGHVDAAVNLSALLCDAGRCAEALAVCNQAIATAAGPDTALLHFNRAIALEDLPGGEAEALRAYQRSLELDPRLADAHYNLARLHEKAGRKQAALRHFSAYRRLQR